MALGDEKFFTFFETLIAFFPMNVYTKSTTISNAFMSKTRMISVRELRQNLSRYLREAEEKNVHFVVMRHAVPVAHVVPVKKKKKSKRDTLEEFLSELSLARKQIERGEGISQAEMERLVGL